MYKRQGEVILFSGEDDFASVVRPRLESASADHQFVNVVDTGTSSMLATQAAPLRRHLQQWELASLESYLQQFQKAGAACRLIVIDPVNCFLAPADGRSDERVRQTLAQLADLAVRSGTAVLLVANPETFEKGRRKRRSATIPFLAAAARSIWTIVVDPDDPRRRMLLPVKTNLCETPPGLAFTIQDQRICWEDEPVEQSAGQFLTDTDEDQRLLRRAAEKELSRATEWLKYRLSAGTVYSKELQVDAMENDISEKTLRRALVALDCRKGKEKKANGLWHWRLPISTTRLLATSTPASTAPQVTTSAVTSRDCLLEAATETRSEAITEVQSLAEPERSENVQQSWPTSTAQNPNETGNLANSGEVG